MAPQAPRLCVLQIIPELKPGGVERSAIEIAQALVNASHRAIIVAKPGAWSNWAKQVGAELIELDLGRKSLRTLTHIWTLRRLINQIQPDIVHTRSRLPSWICQWALRGCQPRPHWFTTIHGLHSVSRYSAIQHAGDVVIAVSQSAKAFVQRHYANSQNKPIHVIARGVDPMVYCPANSADQQAAVRQLDSEFPSIAGKRLLLLPGRGTRLKGHATAIRLLHALQQADLMLALVGLVQNDNQSYVQELQQLAAQLGVTAQLLCLPNRNDLLQWYRRSALVLQLSNRAESFGRTVAESLLCHTPVVGFDVGGVGEQLRLACPAGLVAIDDFAALLQTSKSLLQTKPTINLAAIHTLDQMQQQTLALYLQAVQAGGSST